MCSRAGNGAAGAARQDSPVVLFSAGNANPPAWAIISLRVFVQILQDKIHLMFLVGDVHLATIGFDLRIHPIGQRAQIIHLPFEEVREIEGTESKLQSTRPIWEGNKRSSTMLVIRNVW